MNWINLMLLRVSLLIGGIALASVLFTPNLVGQAQSPNAQQDQQHTQTFAGKIVLLKDGQYALLTDAESSTGYYLDDQDKAKQFAGQNVKVTGVLEVSKKMVHVADIAPA